MQENLKSVLEYLETVPVIEPSGSALESALENFASPEFNLERQAVAIGSQITEFSNNVPADLRPHIANSLLLAQLAASKSIEKGGATSDWYKKYTEVLAKIGWLVEGDLNTEHEIEGTGSQVHKAIMPVITTALGGAAAASLIIPLLKGLENMNQGNPWLTLFDRESKRASANQFQICHVSSENGTAPKLVIVCFGLDASKSVTQVLFFKFSNTSGTLTHSQTELSIQPAILNGSKDAIQAKVATHLSSFISDIEI